MISPEPDYRELLIGCGRARDKRIAVPDSAGPAKWRALTTLDLNPNVGADLQCDLNEPPPWRVFQDRGNSRCFRPNGLLLSDYWDEIHAYEVLEHLGRQGDAHSLLAHFSELWRLLKPNGYLCATVPSRASPWLWGDPSHSRVICAETLIFLDQAQYTAQCDAPHPTPMSDFRDTCGYWADFKPVDHHDNGVTFTFILQAVKPSRYKTMMNERFGPLGRKV